MAPPKRIPWPNALDILQRGARCDVVISEFHRVSIAAGSTDLILSGGAFHASDIGKLIVVTGAGPARAPLATSIVSVEAGDRIKLANPASTAVNGNIWLAYGSDDSKAINAAIATLSEGEGAIVDLPPSGCGIGAPIALPTPWGNAARAQVTLRGQGRGVSSLVALARIDTILDEAASWHQQVHLLDLALEATGLANYGLHLEGGYGGQYRGVDFQDGAIAGLRIGNLPMNDDGTISGNWYAHVSEVQVMQSSATIQPKLFPQGLPPYAILIQGGDSHFTDVIAHGARIANIRDTSGAGNFFTSVHAYGSARYNYWVHGHDSFTNCEVDGAAEAGVRSDDGELVWIGGRMIFGGQSLANVAAFLLTGDNRRTVLNGAVIDQLPRNQFVRTIGNQPPSPKSVNLP